MPSGVGLKIRGLGGSEENFRAAFAALQESFTALIRVFLCGGNESAKTPAEWPFLALCHFLTQPEQLPQINADFRRSDSSIPNCCCSRESRGRPRISGC
jgi:hypothetical protein